MIRLAHTSGEFKIFLQNYLFCGHQKMPLFFCALDANVVYGRVTQAFFSDTLGDEWGRLHGNNMLTGFF